MLPQKVLYYGKDEALPERVRLQAGPLSLIYEAGDLRYIKLGDQEILRRVYVAIRDRNWGTILPEISNVQLDAGSDSFQIRYDVENKAGDIDFFWQGTISGDSHGTITFKMEGEARSTFLRNRVGFCILHPMICAGAACQIEHVDGSREKTSFPKYIAPQLKVAGITKPVPPFEEMQAMAHEVSPGLWAELRFTGDIFEMEDQRNWTDASYKTYCTPLRLPFPVEVEKGTRISQSVSLTLTGEIPQLSTKTEIPKLIFSVAETPEEPIPRIGLGIASHGQLLTEKAVARLRVLNLSHLRVDLKLSHPSYEGLLRRAVTEADKLGISLEIALHLSDAAEDELKALLPLLAELQPSIWTWLIFHEKEKTTTEKWIKLARERLADYDPGAKFGSGTNFFFTELNCNHPPVSVMDLVSYSINPQVHAFDNASLIETLEAQGPTVESTRQFTNNLPLAVGPVTLKMRSNPNATGPEPEPEPGELPSQVDVRQMSLFGAVWTLGSLKYLLESGIQSATYYETTGWRGVMETESGSPVPDKFRSLAGTVFPLYHVLADVGEFAGGEIIPTRSSDTLQVNGLALYKHGKMRVIVANLTDEPRQLTIENLGEQVQLYQLDETNAEAAMRDPEAFRAKVGEVASTLEGALDLELLPYALVRIDA